MDVLRRAGSVLRLAGARLRAGPALVALAVIGMAAGTAVLAAVLAGGLIAQDRSLANAIDDLPPSSQAVRAVSFGVPGQLIEQYGTLDERVRRELATVSGRPPTAIALYRESTVAGTFVGIGAVDGLADWVELESGRLPEECRPEHCEVLLVRGTGRVPSAPGLRLTVVGTARLSSNVLFGDFLAPAENDAREGAPLGAGNQDARYHEPAPAPLVLANGVAGLVASQVLRSVYRSLGWVVPLGDGGVRVWDVGSFRGSVDRARSSLRTVSNTFDLLAPTQELDSARSAGEAGGRRLLLVGGEVAALLFAFAVLAAMSLRGGAAATRQRLVWAGARRWQLVLLTAAEAIALGALGTAVGWAAGAAAGAAIAALADAPAGAVLAHSVVSGPGLAIGVATAVGAACVVFVVLASPALGLRGRSISPLDVAALAALALVGFAVARGDLDRDALAREEGTAPLLTLLPALVTFAAAVLAARLFPPLARALERLARGRSLALRVAFVSLAREPARAAVALAVFVVAISLSLFAATYRTTLTHGQREQAAFEVPPDFIVREDLRRLVPVLDAASLERFEALGNGLAVDARSPSPSAADIVVTPVVRVSGSVARLGTSGATVLGLDTDRIRTLDGWRDDFSSLSRDEVAGRLRPERSTELVGARIPDDARSLVLPFAGPSLTLRAAVRTAEGRYMTVELGRTDQATDGVLRTELPAEARGGEVMALAIRPPKRLVETGASAGRGFTGRLELGELAAETDDGLTPLAPGYPDWVADDGIQVRTTGTGAVLDFTLTGEETSLFRPAQDIDGYAIPAVVSPRLAAAAGRGGLLPLRVGGGDLLVRVVGIVRRFPGIDGEAVVADRGALLAALNAPGPGAGFVNEIWLDAPAGQQGSVASALAEPPFDVLDITSRAETEREIEREPLADGILLTLAAAAIAGLVLGLGGLVLSVLGGLRDDRGTFDDLEAQGAEPRLLRRAIEARAGALAGFGLVGGVVVGVLLGAVVVALVAVSAGVGDAEPPLRLAVDWGLVAVVLAAYVAVAALAVVLTTRLATAREGARR
jgi:hypothetical protein